jgi:DNA repair exonuclease SbcCD ATPase subunit
MKIQRIKLENFRSYAALEIEFPNRITVFRGANHKGKSTIEQAIQYALAARSESTNAAGAGADEYLIRKGSDIARVFLDIEVEGKVDKLRATISRKSGRAVATKDAEGVDTTNIINPWLRSHSDVLSCLTNSRYFVDLDPAKQKDILSGIVLPERWDGWDKEMVAAASTLGFEGLAFFLNEHPFKVIGNLYDASFEMRKNVKRDIANFVAPSGDVTNAGDVDEIKSRLKERRDELTAAQKKRANLLAGIGTKQDFDLQKEKLQLRLDRAIQKQTAEHKALTEQRGKVLDKKQLKANQDAVAQKLHAHTLDMQIAGLEIDIKSLTKTIDEINALESTCPTCQAAISEETKAAVVLPLFERRATAKVELKKVKQDRAAVPSFDLAEQALRDHADAEKEVIRATERLNEANAELTSATFDLESIGFYVAVDTSEVDAEIASLEERVQKGTTRLSEVSAANERKIAFEAATEKMAALKEKLVLLEKLVTYFGPGGVQATLLNEHVGSFTAAMNQVLEAWGYQCLLRFEPDFFFGVVMPTADIRNAGYPWPLRTLSKSERYRFAIAFQVALAMQTGFRFVVIDEMDMLDGEGRGGLMNRIRSSQLDQAILLGTDERDTISQGMASAADFFMVSAAVVDGIPTSSVTRLHAAV